MSQPEDDVLELVEIWSANGREGLLLPEGASEQLLAYFEAWSQAACSPTLRGAPSGRPTATERAAMQHEANSRAEFLRRDRQHRGRFYDALVVDDPIASDHQRHLRAVVDVYESDWGTIRPATSVDADFQRDVDILRQSQPAAAPQE